MASGAQDWVARTDLLLQTLSELIVRYKYGAFQMDSGTYGPFLTTEEREIISFSAKGIILGGYIIGSGGDSSKNDQVWITIDGQQAMLIPFSSYFASSFMQPHQSPLYLSHYDLVNDKYVLSFSRDISFETTISITYDCNKAGGRVTWKLFYATI